jgi:hypothetical protein
MTTSTRVREGLLVKGLGRPVSLNAVDWKIKHDNPSASAAEVQDDTLEVIRTLADDGLVKLGSVRRHRFVASKRPVNRTMRRISRRYVDHYDDPKTWMFSAWMTLTNEGQRQALTLEQRALDSYRDSWAGNDRCEREVSQDVSRRNVCELKQLSHQVARWQTEGDLLHRNVA